MRPKTISDGVIEGVVSVTLLYIYRYKDIVTKEHLVMSWINPLLPLTLIILIVSLFSHVPQGILGFIAAISFFIAWQWVRNTSLFDISQTGKFLTRCAQIENLLAAYELRTGHADIDSLGTVSHRYLMRQALQLEKDRLDSSNDGAEIKEREKNFREAYHLFSLFGGLTVHDSADGYISQARKKVTPKPPRATTRRNLRRGKIRLLE